MNPYLLILCAFFVGWISQGVSGESSTSENCEARYTRLHTDTLEQAGYHEVRPQVLLQSDKTRFVILRDKNGTPLTFAVSRFGKIPPALEQVHAHIRAGASIGKAFRNAGYTVVKKNIASIEGEFSPKVQRLMESETPRATGREYEFHAEKNGVSYFYASIRELDNPAIHIPDSDVR